MAAKKGITSSLFSIILKIIAILAILILLLSYTAHYISPATLWPIAFLGLFYPYILLANIIIAFLWLLLRRWFVVYHVIAIAIGWSYVGTHFQFSGNTSDNNNDTTKFIKVISYNVKNFDLYNYNKDWSFNFEKRNLIFDFLKEENADIINFQEFVNIEKSKFKTADTLVKFLKAKNIHAEYSAITKQNNKFGLATLSSYPIIGEGKINFPGKTNNMCIYTDILYNNDTIRIYNIHLESIHFSGQDYAFASKLKEDINIKQHKNIEHNSKRIINRLKKAFILRSSQAEIVSEHIKQSPYPVIVCGDFNDTPGSYAYHKIAKNLRDAFTESGSGLGTTYSGVFPSFRIDYILYSSSFESSQFNTVENNLSDHYPVKCFINFKEQAKNQ